MQQAYTMIPTTSPLQPLLPWGLHRQACAACTTAPHVISKSPSGANKPSSCAEPVAGEKGAACVLLMAAGGTHGDGGVAGGTPGSDQAFY